jgi:hypothetical protein
MPFDVVTPDVGATGAGVGVNAGAGVGVTGEGVTEVGATGEGVGGAAGAGAGSTPPVFHSPLQGPVHWFSWA